MLQDIRQSIKGTTAKIVVGLIVISFAFFGIESILLSGGGAGIASVNGEDISPVEVQQLVNTEKRRLISIMGNDIDPAILDDQRLGAQALQRIIARKLQMQSAASMDLSASDREVGAVVAGMEQFQIDGKFSPELYKSLLASAGFTPASFMAGLKEDLVLNQLRSGLGGSDFATPAELALNAKVGAELRDIRYFTIPLESFKADTEVSSETIQQYYEANSTRFLSRESVELDYIELTVDAFRQDVDESLVRQQYELEKDSYGYAAENRVSHILFDPGTGDNDEALRARAATVIAELEAGKSFAELAVSSSDDVGSASAGGDLGFSSGDAFPPEMEEAIASLEINGISELVQTDAGLHLIMLTEKREGTAVSFEDMRAELEERLQLDEAHAELLRTVEGLRDYVFNAEDLSDPAERLNLAVLQSDTITRGQQEGLFASASLLAAAFSEDVLEAGHNSEVIEMSSNRYVVLRVRSHHAPEVKPLEDVRVDIIQKIIEASALASIGIEADRALASLQSGASIESFANEHNYQWQVELAAGRGNAVVPRAVLRRAFELPVPAEGSSVFEYVITATGDVEVLELVRVTAGDYSILGGRDKLGLQQQIGGEFGSLTDVEYQNGLRARADISIL